MKNIRLLILIGTLILSGLIFQSCNKENDLDLEIKSEQWNLISINENDVLTVKEPKDYFRDNAFILIFETDSTFSLNTGVNYAGGKYMISSLNEMTIFSYHEFTEVATTDKNEQELTDKLIQQLPKVTGYTIENDKLSLITDDGNVLFKIK